MVGDFGVVSALCKGPDAVGVRVAGTGGCGTGLGRSGVAQHHHGAQHRDSPKTYSSAERFRLLHSGFSKRQAGRHEDPKGRRLLRSSRRDTAAESDAWSSADDLLRAHRAQQQPPMSSPVPPYGGFRSTVVSGRSLRDRMTGARSTPFIRLCVSAVGVPPAACRGHTPVPAGGAPSHRSVARGSRSRAPRGAGAVRRREGCIRP